MISEEAYIDFNFNENIDQQLIVNIEAEEKIWWQDKGNNSNIRDAGTSQRTLERNEAKKKIMKKNVLEHSQPIRNYFEIGDDEYINNVVYANYDDSEEMSTAND